MYIMGGDAFYFSFVVHFTIGFCDIYPTTTGSRTIVMIHTILFWFINLVNSELVQYAKKTFDFISKIEYIDYYKNK
jgi:hypothetical protein